MSDTEIVTGAEFLRKVKGAAGRRGVAMRLDHKRGKGSHGTLYFGLHRTILPDLKRELKPGTLRAILRQISLTPQDLDQD